MRRRWLRWTIRLAVWPLVLVLATALSGVAWIGWTQSGTRWALGLGLEQYGARIPGSVRIDGIEGVLFERIRLAGVTARDREGRSLIELRALTLDWSLTDLFDWRISVPALEVDGLTVHLWPGIDPPPFGDLAPPGEAAPAPAPPSADEPSSAAIALAAAIDIDGVDVVEHHGDALTPLVRDFGVSLHVTARYSDEQPEADVWLTALRAEVPAAPVRIERLDLRARWRSPNVEVIGLHLRTDRGRLDLARAAFDPAAQVGAASFAMSAPPDALVPWIGRVLPHAPSLQFDGAGGLEGFEGTLVAATDDGAEARLEIKGALQPAPRLDARIEFRTLRPLAYGLEPEAELTGEGRITVRGPPTPLDQLATLDPSALTVDAALDCDPCRVQPMGAIRADVKATLEGGRGEAHVGVAALGLDVVADARIGDIAAPETSDLWVKWRVSARDIGPAAALGGAAGLAGALRTGGTCEGALDALVCAGRVDIERFSGFDAAVERAGLTFRAQPTARPIRFEADLEVEGARAPGVPGRIDAAVDAEGEPERVELRVDAKRTRADGEDAIALAAEIRPGPPLRVHLARLKAHAMGHDVELRSRAQIAWAPPRATIDGLTLRADGVDVDVDGVVALEGPGDVQVTLHAPRLATLATRLPGVDVEGALDAKVRVSGALSAPRIGLEAKARDLRWQAATIGDLSVDATVGGGRARVELALDAGGGRTVDLDASAPIALDALGGRVAWRRGGRHSLDLRIEQIDHEWLARFAAPPDGLAFDADARAILRGSVAAPVVTVDVQGSAERAGIGHVTIEVDVDARDGEQTVAATIDAPGTEAIRLRARTGVRVNEALGGRLDPSTQILDAEVLVPRLDLVTLAAFLPPALREPAGILAIRARAGGTWTVPSIDADIELNAAALTLEALGLRLTDVDVDVHLEERMLDLQTLRFAPGAGRGALADHAVVDAKVQLSGKLRASPQNRSASRSTVLPADSRPRTEPTPGAEWLARLAAPPEGLVFDSDLRVSMGGTDSAPTATVDAKGSIEPSGVGRVTFGVDVDARDGEQTVVATINVAGAEAIRLRASTGVHVAEALEGRLDPAIQILDTEVIVPGFDLTTLASFVPPALYGPAGILAIRARAGGTWAAPSINGHVGLKDGALTLVPLGLRLTDIGIDARIEERMLHLEALRFAAGDGRGELTGHAGLDARGELDGALRFSLDRFTVRSPGAPPLRLATQVDLALGGPPTGHAGAVEVDVQVTKTAVIVLGTPSAGPKSIPESDAMIFVDAAAVREREQAAALVDNLPAPPAVPVHIALRLPEPLRISGPFLDMAWGGRIDVRSGGELGAPTVDGGLTAETGRFDLLGNTFEVDRGTVTLAAGEVVEPYIDLEAHTETAEARVIVEIRGKASAPTLTLRVQPPMPQFQILSLLVTGTAEQNEESESQVENKAAAILASFSNPALERHMSDHLGVDRVRVGFGDTVDEPIVALGKSVTRWLYVETRYHHNAPEEDNETEVRAEVRLAPRWTLETAYGDAAIGGIDVFWRAPLRDEADSSQGTAKGSAKK